MTNARPYGEYFSSTEYLREYGGLIVDLSNLLETLDNSPVPKIETNHYFIENIDNSPLPVPQSINDRIGDVSSAHIAYMVNDLVPSVSIEFFGQQETYRLHRTEVALDDNDTILSIPPVDSFMLEFQGGDNSQPLLKPYGCEPSDKFEKRIKTVPGLSRIEVIRALMTLSQPSLAESSTTTLSDNRLTNINLFEGKTLQALMDSSASTAQSQAHFLEYSFIADGSATLTYSQENGQPMSFEFSCTDPANESLRIRGSLAQSPELEFPQHAIAQGLHHDEVVTLRSFPPTLSEIKYIRKLLATEIQSLPPAETLEIESINTPDYGIAHDDAIIELRSLAAAEEQEERALEEAAQLGYISDLAAEIADKAFDDEIKQIFKANDDEDSQS